MLGADLPLAERDRVLHPSGGPVRGLPVGLTLFENPVGCLGQIASGGADGDGVALAAVGALEEVDDVLAAPVGVVAVADDHVGGFDESPLQVGVGLFDHAAVVDVPTAGADFGDQAAVAGEVLGSAEAVDGADFETMTMARMAPTPGRVWTSWMLWCA